MKHLGLKRAKKAALIAVAAIGGAALGAFLGPYAAKLGKKVVSAVKTYGKKIACKVTKKGCFVAGTEILTENGKVPIEDVEVGDFHTYYVGNSSVLVHNMCCLRGKDAANAAQKLGYKPTNYYSKGQRVFYNSKTKTYITADVDGHIGGVWKMAKSVKDLSSKSTRLGTYDASLKWIGK